jgi:hypothetical protein
MEVLPLCSALFCSADAFPFSPPPAAVSFYFISCIVFGLLIDSYESIKMIMTSLPTFTSKRAAGEIDVKTRDYLISQAQGEISHFSLSPFFPHLYFFHTPLS